MPGGAADGARAALPSLVEVECGVAMIPFFAFLQGAAPQTDALTRLLHQQQLTPWMIAAALGIAFVLGAAHALTPGHGKTIVAAYLVGSRGTLKHAAFLGAMVTFTHTISVFALGLATLFLTKYINQEKITQVLGAVSGLTIVVIGGSLFYKRFQKLRADQAHERAHAHGHHHAHGHSHGRHHDHHHHDHPHVHTHDHDHAHEHSHD